MEGGEQRACGHQTHIHDLLDECLVEILRRLDTVSLPASSWTPVKRTHMGTFAVAHPLQCALVCRRWRALADEAVRGLHVCHLAGSLAQQIGRRFKRLTLLALPCGAGIGARGALAHLAHLTPQLERLHLLRHYGTPYDVAQALPAWPNLRTLKLDWPLHFSATSFVDAVCKLSSLQHLRFFSESEDVLAICERVAAMESVTTLEVECSHVPSASSRVCEVLRMLKLDGYMGAELPDSLGLFTGLEVLSLGAHACVSLPESLGRLSQLTELELLHCYYLASLPSTLGQLAALKALRMEHCHAMQGWPDSFSLLEDLQVLELTGCRALPRNVGHLTELKRLKIHEFLRLPQGMGNLRSLRELDLKNSYELKALPDSLSCLTNLEVCQVREWPRLLRLPEGLGELQMLRELDLSRCGSLRELPEGLGQLRGLKTLRLDCCQSLMSVPEVVRSLRCFQPCQPHAAR